MTTRRLRRNESIVQRGKGGYHEDDTLPLFHGYQREQMKNATTAPGTGSQPTMTTMNMVQGNKRWPSIHLSRTATLVHLSRLTGRRRAECSSRSIEGQGGLETHNYGWQPGRKFHACIIRHVPSICMQGKTRRLRRETSLPKDSEASL